MLFHLSSSDEGCVAVHKVFIDAAVDRGEGGGAVLEIGTVLQRATSPLQRAFAVPLLNAASAASDADVFLLSGPPAAGAVDLFL